MLIQFVESLKIYAMHSHTQMINGTQVVREQNAVFLK